MTSPWAKYVKEKNQKRKKSQQNGDVSVLVKVAAEIHSPCFS